MATMTSINFSVPRVVAMANDSQKQPLATPCLNYPWRNSGAARRMRVVVVAAAPDKIEDKVEESIKNAEEACAGNANTGECAAAWDEVEELSAAVSHAKEKKQDPLDAYCKDNPESEECRTYDD